MSLYNALNGFNPACVYILPMLGRPHTWYPRFRDCFVAEEDGEQFIDVFTRCGGLNRGQGYGDEEALYHDPNFVKTWDDSFDSTYGTFRFRVPEEWKDDFQLVMSGELPQTSEKYKELVYGFYPKLKEQLDKWFDIKKEENE